MGPSWQAVARGEQLYYICSTYLMLSDQQISRALSPYGVSADARLCDRIRSYVSLLLHWNQRVSLTTITNIEEILKFHFGESFFASVAAPVKDGRLADVGSGAGFPGIPLAMIAPRLEVTLIESNVKKSAFLSEVARSLGLSHVHVLRSRMEECPTDLRELGFVTARAIGNFENLLKWSAQRLSPEGKIVLWLSENEAEQRMADTSWSWQDPLHIPGSRTRVILVGSGKRRE